MPADSERPAAAGAGQRGKRITAARRTCRWLMGLGAYGCTIAGLGTSESSSIAAALVQQAAAHIPDGLHILAVVIDGNY